MEGCFMFQLGGGGLFFRWGGFIFKWGGHPMGGASVLMGGVPPHASHYWKPWGWGVSVLVFKSVCAFSSKKCFFIGRIALLSPRIALFSLEVPFCFLELPFCCPEVPYFYLLCASFSKIAFFLS